MLVHRFDHVVCSLLLFICLLLVHGPVLAQDEDGPIGGAPVYGNPALDPALGGAPVYGAPEEDDPIGGPAAYGDPVWDPPIGGAPAYGDPVEEEDAIGGDPLQ